MKTGMMKLEMVGVAALAILATTLPAQAADGTWTNAAGGTWATAGNWQGSVLPDTGNANLTMTGVNYAVNYDAAAPAVSNLVVSNKAPYQTAMVVSAPLTNIGAGTITLDVGARVSVTNNGAWTATGNSTGTRVMTIKNGAELNICGGSVQFTNLSTSSTRDLWIGDGSTGTLRVTAGTFSHWDNGHSQWLYVGRGTGGDGLLAISNGATANVGGAQWSFFIGWAGHGKVQVEGTLNLPGTVPSTKCGISSGGFGELVVTNGGIIRPAGGTWYFGVGENCRGEGHFSGTTLVANVNNMYIGYNSDTSGRGTGLVEIASGALRLDTELRVGFAGGGPNYQTTGALNIYGGAMTNDVYNGVWIGTANKGGNAEGALTMTGGTMAVNYSRDLTYPGNVSPWGYAVCGLVIGHIGDNAWDKSNVDDTSPDTRARGTLTLSGGSIIDKYHFAVGGNGGTGTVIQTGGSITHLPVDTNRLMLIGYGLGTNSYSGAGNGTYDMSGGTFTTPSRVFVGGLPTNVQWYARSGAVGLLRVSGGSFVVSNTVYVGENGSGTVIMGSNGTLTVGNLYATNTASKLRFELGSAGIGTFTVTNELRVGSASLLEVDVKNFRQGGMTKLLDCKTRTGSFAAANISVTGGPGTVVQTKDEDIYLNITRGSVVTVR